MITYRYHTDPLTLITTRTPINLTTGAIDWLRAEPWTEPPLLAPMPRQARKRRYDVRRVLMTCNKCGYQKMQCQRRICLKCREGVMTHTEGKVKILVRDKRNG